MIQKLMLLIASDKYKFINTNKHKAIRTQTLTQKMILLGT